MALLSPLLSKLSLDALRRGQDLVGELMEAKYRRDVIVKKHKFDNFEGAWVIPADERREGVILYLHGGGFVCGGLDYSLGFGSMLAAKSGARVFCPAYRLAPEHRFPAALDDAETAYKYLLEKGYSPSHIALCGESAGGGLCYSLCIRLREAGLEMPSSIIAISPWSDLTASGASYAQNKDSDPSMTLERLDFFAKNYTDDRCHPLVSPLFADLHGMPPSIIFAARNEIMYDDALFLHNKLLSEGCRSRLHEKDERWHAYMLYGLDEDKKDIDLLCRFLSQNMAEEHKLRWLRLDNAAKIYPAARRENWSNVFRVSATLYEDVDTDILRCALDVTLRRFPSIAVRLRRGVFWYYLEQLESAPEIRADSSYPLAKMSKRETRKCAFRVLVYRGRIAVEIFHSLTDGTGALIFLKSLVAEYLQQKHGVNISAEHGVLARLDEPKEEELEDSFQKNAGTLKAKRGESSAYHLSGTPEERGFLNLTCFKINVRDALECAHRYGVSLTVFLCATLMQAIQEMQKKKIPTQRRRAPIKVLVPVNLRNIFPSSTLRNFAFYTTPEILPALGEYSFREICNAIFHKMGADITPKQMSMHIAANVGSERMAIVRIMPLFIKNFVMKAIYDVVGERTSCLSMSNLGAVKIPDEMKAYIERFDFILGVQATTPYNCGVISYGDTLYFNFIRGVKESELEAHFHKALLSHGICAEVESNRSTRETR